MRLRLFHDAPQSPYLMSNVSSKIFGVDQFHDADGFDVK